MMNNETASLMNDENDLKSVPEGHLNYSFFISHHSLFVKSVLQCFLQHAFFHLFFRLRRMTRTMATTISATTKISATSTNVN